MQNGRKILRSCHKHTHTHTHTFICPWEGCSLPAHWTSIEGYPLFEPLEGVCRRQITMSQMCHPPPPKLRPLLSTLKKGTAFWHQSYMQSLHWKTDIYSHTHLFTCLKLTAICGHIWEFCFSLDSPTKLDTYSACVTWSCMKMCIFQWWRWCPFI